MPLWDISLQNLSDFDFDFSGRSLKVKSHGAIGLPIHDFPISACKIWPNSPHYEIEEFEI